MRNYAVCILSLFLFLSCSEDDSLDCDSEVWGLSSDGSVYRVEYGPSEDMTTTIEVNEKTYNYYSGIVDDEDKRDCWEGTK